MRNPNVQLLSCILPDDLIMVIDKYFAYPKKKKVSEVSPSMQRELKKIQTMYIRKLPANYMKGLDDFCLD